MPNRSDANWVVSTTMPLLPPDSATGPAFGPEGMLPVMSNDWTSPLLSPTKSRSVGVMFAFANSVSGEHSAFVLVRVAPEVAEEAMVGGDPAVNPRR